MGVLEGGRRTGDVALVMLDGEVEWVVGGDFWKLVTVAVVTCLYHSSHR